MKKFLSLVLSLAMAMSLVTISAGAKDFTDDSKIAYKEAVDVISAIDVVDGYTDGSFNPTNQLTRGAAAKIICNLVLGPTTADALSADTAPFSDVPVSNEFSGYIAYCSQQGIINGYSDGTFRPAGTLTGYAFMKMLLGALGYDGEVEGFTGPNWSVQVAKLALGAGLDDGNEDFLGTAPVTREEACLYAFNTLKANMVQYDSRTSVNVGGAEVIIAGSKAENIPQAGSGYDNTMGDGNSEYAPVVQFAERYFPKLTRTRQYHDAFGRPANEWKYRSEVIGLYADDSTLLETYTAKVNKGDLYNLIGGSIVDDLSATGDGDGGYELTVWVDGDEVASPVVSNYFAKNSTGAAGVKDAVRGTGQTGNGVLTEVYMDDDNNVNIVIVNTYLVKATADYNTTTETLNFEVVDEINTDTASTDNPIMIPSMGTTLENDDVYVADFKADDYILVTYSYDEDAIQSAQLAEVVTGEVSEYTQKTNVFIGGEKYVYNKMVGNTESNVTYTIGEDAVVVLDAYGNILYVDQAVSTNSYVFLADMVSTAASKTVRFNAYFTDGTYEEIVVKRLDGSSTTANIQAADSKWYTFSEDENGRFSLNTVKTPLDTKETTNVSATKNNASDVDVIENGKVEFAATELPSTLGDNSTVFVVLERDGDVTAYTGVANAPDITIPETAAAVGTPGTPGYVPAIDPDQYATVHVVYNTDTNYADYVFVDLSNAPDADVEDANSVADFLFILKPTNNKTYVADDEYWQYEVVMDNEKTTKYIAESIGAAKGDLMRNVKENAKGYITDADPFDDAARRDVINLTGSSLINFSNGTLSIDTNGDGTADASYVIKDDCNGTLMVNSGVPALLRDDDASYELYQTTVRSAASVVKNYAVNGKVYVAVTADGGTVATDVYFFISGATQLLEAAETPVPPTLSAASYQQGDTATALSATTTVSDGGTVTYQWYKDGVAISGATGATYTPSTAEIGSAQYYCAVTNTNNAMKDKPVVTVNTNTVTITVTEADPAKTFIVSLAVKGTGEIKGAARITVDAMPNTDGLLFELTEQDIIDSGRLPAGYKVDTTDADLKVYSGTNEESVTVDIIAKETTATITADDKSIKADGSDASSATQTVTIDKNGSLVSAEVTDVTDTDTTHTAAVTDLVVTFNPADGELSIAIADGVTLDATDVYEITITGLAEDGVTEVTNTINITISSI